MKVIKIDTSKLVHLNYILLRSFRLSDIGFSRSLRAICKVKFIFFKSVTESLNYLHLELFSFIVVFQYLTVYQLCFLWTFFVLVFLWCTTIIKYITDYLITNRVQCTQCHNSYTKYYFKKHKCNPKKGALNFMPKYEIANLLNLCFRSMIFYLIWFYNISSLLGMDRISGSVSGIRRNPMIHI